MKDHFNKIFWFIVGLTAFGAGYTIFVQIRFSGDVAARFADQAQMFWLSTAVGGGIGYLIGSSVKQSSSTPVAGTTKADISATIITENQKEDEKK